MASVGKIINFVRFKHAGECRFILRKMIGLEQIKELQQRVDTLGRCIAIDEKRADVAARQEKTLAPDFWDDPKGAEKFLK